MIEVISHHPPTFLDSYHFPVICCHLSKLYEKKILGRASLWKRPFLTKYGPCWEEILSLRAAVGPWSYNHRLCSTHRSAAVANTLLLCLMFYESCRPEERDCAALPEFDNITKKESKKRFTSHPWGPAESSRTEQLQLIGETPQQLVCVAARFRSIGDQVEGNIIAAMKQM